jgi:hypothetical protein
MKGWMKIAAGVAGFAILAVAFIGFLHLPAARPLLGKLGVACPVLKNVKPEMIDARRRKHLEDPSAPPAPTRPAFGLALDESTLGDGKSWADSHGLKCSEHTRGYSYLQCTDVAPGAIGEGYATAPIDMLVLTFGSKGTLIGVQTYRHSVEAQAASDILRLGASDLEKQLGPPTARNGDASPAALGKGTFASAQVSYKFRDYLATLRAANLSGKGVVVTEKFYSTAL